MKEWKRAREKEKEQIISHEAAHEKMLILDFVIVEDASRAAATTHIVHTH